MASKITLDNISVGNNPAYFLDNIELEITFTAIDTIPEQLEWKVIYVGSAKDQAYDQILEEFQIGPIGEQSTMKFTVDCPPPDYSKIPRDELICVTALIITVSYRSQEFIRVGYYVHNVLTEDIPQEERSTASAAELVRHTRRTILTDKPRITKFRINWGDQPMKEQTNNAKMKMETPCNSNSSLLARKVGLNLQNESGCQEKQSTREQKDCNSHSLMKSEYVGGQQEVPLEESS